MTLQFHLQMILSYNLQKIFIFICRIERTMFANIVLKNEAIQWQPVMKFIYFFQVSKNDIMSTLNSLRWQTHIRWIEKFNHVALYRDILKCLITIFDIFEFKIIPSLKL